MVSLLLSIRALKSRRERRPHNYTKTVYSLSQTTLEDSTEKENDYFLYLRLSTKGLEEEGRDLRLDYGPRHRTHNSVILLRSS